MSEAREKLQRIVGKGRPYLYGVLLAIVLFMALRSLFLTVVVVNDRAPLPFDHVARDVRPASTFHTDKLVVDSTSIFGGLMTVNSNIALNTNGDSALFSTFKGADSNGGNIWVGGGGQVSVGNPGNHDLGSQNTSYGFGSLIHDTTGWGNTAIGGGSAGALFANTIGNFNTAVGADSLSHNVDGEANIGIGDDTLSFNVHSSHCIAVGDAALTNHLVGDNSIAIGHLGQTNANGGTNVISIGTSALAVNSANNCIAIGTDSQGLNTSGVENISIGTATLASNLTGQDNFVAGHSAMVSNVDGSYNVAIGLDAFATNVSGAQSVAIGTFALRNATNNLNTAVGVSTLQNLTSGDLNTAYGWSTGLGITTGRANTILGANVTGLAPTLSNNIILADGDGHVRMQTDSTGLSTLFGNVAIDTNGDTALLSTFKGAGVPIGQNIWIGGGGQLSVGDGGVHPAYGAGNVSLGVEAAKNITIGNDVTAVGGSALRDLTDGGDDVAIGRSSMQFSVHARQDTCIGVNSCEVMDGTAGLGANNVGIGLDSLESMTTGFRSIGIGAESLASMVDGNSLVCIGDEACHLATTGSNTTAVGGLALSDLLTGDANTVVGHASGGGLTTGRANTILGAGVTGLAAGLSNNVIISDGDGHQRIDVDSAGLVSIPGALSIFGSILVGPGQQIIQGGTPSANHGSLGTGSTDFAGNVTGIGANTSVVLTYSVAFPTRSWCFAQANSTSVALESIVVTNSASAPTFACFSVASGLAVNCDDFSYECLGQ